MKQKKIIQHPEDANASSSQLCTAGTGTDSRKKPTLRRLATAAAALGISFAFMFGGVTASQATSASNGVAALHSSMAAQPANVAPRGAISWSYYDGSEITSSRNCESRMYYLRGIYSWDPTAHFMCQKYTAGTGYTYWLVLIGYTQ